MNIVQQSVAPELGHFKTWCPKASERTIVTRPIDHSARLSGGEIAHVRSARPHLIGHLRISLIEQASHTTARALLKRALAIKEAVYGPDHPQVAIILTNLGVP